MSGYEEKSRSSLTSGLGRMGKRLGISYQQKPANIRKPSYEIGEINPRDRDKIHSVLEPEIVGIENQATILGANGGLMQQERMIFDKRRSLDRAKLYSYQGAVVRKIGENFQGEPYAPCRGLINPNKNKFDYDDKIISIEYEYGLKTGDVFEWMNTNSYWIITLQDLTELAYFRGEIRKCSYEIAWEDEDGSHSTYAAVRGPVETKIDFIQKHLISVDEPNHSLHILMPRTKETLEYFRRYAKFYLKGEDEGSPLICWRVEATDWISTPGILEITAVEYFVNKDEDDLDEKVVGALVAKPINPNDEVTEATIVGETFIHPKQTYEYYYQGPRQVGNAQWTTDKKYPMDIIVDEKDRTRVKIKWKSNYSSQIILSYGNYEKTIVIESLF